MSTHNICFCREIRKLLCGYPLLSVAMHMDTEKTQMRLEIKGIVKKEYLVIIMG